MRLDDPSTGANLRGMRGEGGGGEGGDGKQMCGMQSRENREELNSNLCPLIDERAREMKRRRGMNLIEIKRKWQERQRRRLEFAISWGGSGCLQLDKRTGAFQKVLNFEKCE